MAYDPNTRGVTNMHNEDARHPIYSYKQDTAAFREFIKKRPYSTINQDAIYFIVSFMNDIY
jgi:hypothetical protein